MNANERQPQPNSTGLVSDVLRERTAHQLAQLDGLDSKTATALGFAGVLLGLLFANSSITEHWNGWLTAAVVLLVLGAVALAASLRVQSWMVKPTERKLRSWTSRPRGQTEQLVAASLEVAIVHNRRQAAKKVGIVRIGMVLLTAAIIVAAIGLMMARSNVAHTTSAARHTSTGSSATR